MSFVIQKRIYDLKEREWVITRKNLTKKIFGKSLIPEKLTDVKIVLTRVESGGEFSLHKDSYHHVFYFIEGQGEGWLGDKTYDIKPGRVVEVPAGESHGYKNTAEEDLILITINIPIL